MVTLVKGIPPNRDNMWANHERRAAQARALNESYDCILPARFDDTVIEGLLPTTAYVDLRKHSPEDVAVLICQKIGRNPLLQDAAAEVRASRRTLTVPVIVVTGGRGSNAEWLELQRDMISLSRRGCPVVAAQSGHVVPIGEPRVVVDAVRAIVDDARGSGVGATLCEPLAARVV